MIWVILAAIGVPLWLCALALTTMVFRNRSLRKRPGNVPVRIRMPGKTRWSPGHGVWIHDVFAFRGSPAAWKEALILAEDAIARPASADERKRLHRIGDEPVIATLKADSGESIDLAARGADRWTLLGPFARSERLNGQIGEVPTIQVIRERKET